jgi:hypothetical protein
VHAVRGLLLAIDQRAATFPLETVDTPDGPEPSVERVSKDARDLAVRIGALRRAASCMRRATREVLALRTLAWHEGYNTPHLARITALEAAAREATVYHARLCCGADTDHMAIAAELAGWDHGTDREYLGPNGTIPFEWAWARSVLEHDPDAEPPRFAEGLGFACGHL